MSADQITTLMNIFYMITLHPDPQVSLASQQLLRVIEQEAADRAQHDAAIAAMGGPFWFCVEHHQPHAIDQYESAGEALLMYLQAKQQGKPTDIFCEPRN